MNINLNMTTDRAGKTECGRLVPVGTHVIYVCHVVRAVKVRMDDGTEVIVNGNLFPETRDA